MLESAMSPVQATHVIPTRANNRLNRTLDESLASITSALSPSLSLFLLQLFTQRITRINSIDELAIQSPSSRGLGDVVCAEHLRIPSMAALSVEGAHFIRIQMNLRTGLAPMTCSVRISLPSRLDEKRALNITHHQDTRTGDRRVNWHQPSEQLALSSKWPNSRWKKSFEADEYASQAKMSQLVN